MRTSFASRRATALGDELDKQIKVVVVDLQDCRLHRQRQQAQSDAILSSAGKFVVAFEHFCFSAKRGRAASVAVRILPTSQMNQRLNMDGSRVFVCGFSLTLQRSRR